MTVMTKPPDTRDVAALRRIMADLRSPEGGCPWDIAQSFATIAPFTIEEAYEVADAIERGAMDELAGELGDLLLQVVYHAQMAAEADLFTFDDVVTSICDKMIRRHPHVYGDGAAGARARLAREFWEDAKTRERASVAEAAKSGVLDGVARALPALSRAVKLQRRAARIGFDWPDVAQVLAKAREELDELEQAIGHGDRAGAREEIGDLLFVCANLARHLEVDPEVALSQANSKFTRRFTHIEDELRRRGRPIEDASLEEMDAIWNAAKLAGRRSGGD